MYNCNLICVQLELFYFKIFVTTDYCNSNLENLLKWLVSELMAETKRWLYSLLWPKRSMRWHNKVWSFYNLYWTDVMKPVQKPVIIIFQYYYSTVEKIKTRLIFFYVCTLYINISRINIRTCKKKLEQTTFLSPLFAKNIYTFRLQLHTSSCTPLCRLCR